MALAAVGVLAGAVLGLLGGTAGAGAVLALPLAGAAAALALRDPRWAVAGTLAAAPWGLVELAAGVQVVQVLGVLTLGAVVLGRRPAAPARALPAELLWAGALVTWALVTTLPSSTFQRSLRVDANLLVGLALCACVVAVCRRGPDLRLLLSAWCAGSLVVCLPALQGAGGLSSRYGGALVEGRATGAFVQPNEFGTYCMTTVFVALALLLAGGRRVQRGLAAAALVAGLLGLALSLSRGAWLGTAAGLVALLVLRPALAGPALRAAAAGAAALALLLALTPLGGAAAVVGQRLTSVADPAGNPDDHRDLVFREAARLVAESPVTGHGPGSFKVEAEEADSLVAAYHRLHAHQVPLHVAAETGLVGLALLLGLTAATGAAVVAAARSPAPSAASGPVAALGGGLVAVAGQGLVDVTFQNPLVMALVWALLGLASAAAGTARATLPPARVPGTSPLAPHVPGAAP
ncbi:O-antigen ligase family protein [Vallicoccus soli]|uniref:O-antigen ligase-related domain-containing protein n=1 Tax=Vallicoccus soli TaxID=2339232 RepID=A0A3A3Z4P2_9ACTN|nr:O-antigen ligase family protein [Vallicoccus soli]RJK97908.1 hypothetical protein D5H78_02775 [Vallicoccus soli]